jgi:hypothetical protein
MVGQRIESSGERDDRVAGWADHQVISAAGAVDGSHPTEHRFQLVKEVLVDGHLGAVQLHVPGLLPGRRAGLTAGLAAG